MALSGVELQDFAVGAISAHVGFHYESAGIPQDLKSTLLELRCIDARAAALWHLVNHHKEDNPPTIALNLLLYACGNEFAKHPLYLDLLQKVSHFSSMRAPTVCTPLIEELVRSAHRSPNFPDQLDKYLENLPGDVCTIMRSLGAELACGIMMRGAIVKDGSNIPMSVVRQRLLDKVQDYGDLQRLYMQCRNAQFLQVYNALSHRELLEELAARGVSAGRKDARCTMPALTQRLQASDETWAAHVEVAPYGKLGAELACVLGLFDALLWKPRSSL